MANQISKEGKQTLIKNVRNPLVSIYDKFQAQGTLKFDDIKDEFDFIMQFTKDVDGGTGWSESGGPEHPTVLVNNKLYKPVQEA